MKETLALEIWKVCILRQFIRPCTMELANKVQQEQKLSCCHRSPCMKWHKSKSRSLPLLPTTVRSPNLSLMIGKGAEGDKDCKIIWKTLSCFEDQRVVEKRGKSQKCDSWGVQLSCGSHMRSRIKSTVRASALPCVELSIRPHDAESEGYSVLVQLGLEGLQLGILFQQLRKVSAARQSFS